LPIDPITREPVSPEVHGYIWTNIIQFDNLSPIVEAILNLHPSLALELSLVEDRQRRSAINIASQANQTLLKEATYFMKRYEIITMDYPRHKSLTSIVHIAIDHRAESNDNSGFDSTGKKAPLQINRNDVPRASISSNSNSDNKRLSIGFSEIELNSSITPQLKSNPGKPRSVALKFMRGRAEFEREIDTRTR
jgi:hypothetical protein